MVTWGNVEFEHETPKISFVTEKAAILMAGDAIRGSKIVREIKAAIQAIPTIEQIAQQTTQHYARLRDEQVEIDQFRSRGLTRDRFYKGESPLLTGQAFFGIDQYVMNFNYGVELLIAGVDDAGSHLYSVGHPAGNSHDFAQIGYHAIGSGGAQAIQSMIGFSHASFRSLAETVFAVYSSKRRAEVAPGVGKDTDLAIIEASGTVRFDKAGLAKLEKLYQQYLKPVGDKSLEQVSDLLKKLPK
jgi:20S proteasome alpha/beta subunit